MTGTFTPNPGRAPAATVLARHTRFEIAMTARRGEAVVLSLAVPIIGMLAAGLTDVIRLPSDDRPGYVVPGAIALAVMSTAFTGQAISVGYERFYGVLSQFGASSLTRTGLLASKTAEIYTLVLAQSLVLAGIGAAIGWRPHAGQLPAALGVTLLACAAYSGFGLVLASLLRPETTTAVATLLYTVLLIVGGVLFPAPDLGNAQYLVPTTAHAEALRLSLTAGQAVPAWAWYGLGLWTVLGVFAAARTFRWE
jgi:ABC-2 type transport system permease protein